jgi:hypothetical protein
MTDNSLADTIGAELTSRAQSRLQDRAKMFGDPTVELFNKTRMARIILDAAGVTQGQPFTARVHAAMELSKIAVGLLRGDPNELLADAGAHIGGLAQVEGVEAQLVADKAAAAGKDAVEKSLAPDAWSLTDIRQPQDTVIDDPEHGLLRLDGIRWIAQDGSGWMDGDGGWHPPEENSGQGEQRQHAA